MKSVSLHTITKNIERSNVRITHTWPEHLQMTICLYLLLLYNYAPSWYSVTFANLPPLHLQLSHPPQTENRLFTLPSLWKSRSFQGHYSAWRPGCPGPLSTQADPALQGRPLCVIRLFRHCAPAGWLSKPGQQESWTWGTFVCVCVCVYKEKGNCSCLGDSWLFVRSFEELTLRHF